MVRWAGNRSKAARLPIVRDLFNRLFRPKGRAGFGAVLGAAFRSFFDKGGPTTSAAIAYFALITIFPAFLLLVAITDELIKTHNYSRVVALQVLALFPEGTRKFILQNLETMTSTPSWGAVITYASIFLWAGLWVFHLVEDALDKAWSVEGKRSFWTRRLNNFGMLVLSTLCFLGSTMLMAILYFLRPSFVTADVELTEILFQLLLGLSAYLLTAFLLTLLYKTTPNTEVHFNEAVSGGLIAALIWHLANSVFVWSIPYFHYEYVYGSVWALVVIVVWIYVSCWIVLIGAHLTFHIHRFAVPKEPVTRRGRKTAPPVPPAI